MLHITSSMTRLGDLLDFSHILRELFKSVKIFNFSSEIILGILYRHWATF